MLQEPCIRLRQRGPPSHWSRGHSHSRHGFHAAAYDSHHDRALQRHSVGGQGRSFRNAIELW
jgi:hypothetical protein